MCGSRKFLPFALLCPMDSLPRAAARRHTLARRRRRLDFSIFLKDWFFVVRINISRTRSMTPFAFCCPFSLLPITRGSEAHCWSGSGTRLTEPPTRAERTGPSYRRVKIGPTFSNCADDSRDDWSRRSASHATAAHSHGRYRVAQRS